MRIENGTKATLVAGHAWVADCFWKRLKGLLGTKSLKVGQGLVIKPCNSVHTFGMTYPIDVLFMDSDDRIVKIIAGMKASRMGMALGSSYVIELPIGTAKGTMCMVGDLLILK